jgi:FAD/FMN-containing dehydrogenase
MPPVADLVGPLPYTVQQTLIDAAAPWGQQIFLKSANLTDLSDDVVAIIVRYATRPTSPLSIVPINAWGGAISRVAEDATAFGYRDSTFSIYIFAGWPDPSDGERHVAWARAFHAELRPHMNGSYVNEIGQEGRIHEAYPPTIYARLVEVKNRYDPTNFFRMNLNIKPTT